MREYIYRYHGTTLSWHVIAREIIVVVFFLAILLIAVPASSATVGMRFDDRGLYMSNASPDEVSSYTVSFKYMTLAEVGSFDLLFCIDPIPHHECVPPAGLDVSNATLASQTGEVGFSVLSKDTNHIVLTRDADMISSPASSYQFDNIINPSDISTSFSIRIKSHQTPDATGVQIDYGSVKGQVTRGVVIETQVPPMLIFCVAEVVSDNCTSTNENYYKDLGMLDSESTLVTQSQMAVGTNATGGFSIIVFGAPMSAGTNVIDSPTEPTGSTPGVNQFGINLVENNFPAVGSDPYGDWENAVPTLDYGTPDMFKFENGSLVAYSPNVSLMKKFTVSYIVNSSEELNPGVYTTTVTYVASGRF
jgi:hypothetical protein